MFSVILPRMVTFDFVRSVPRSQLYSPASVCVMSRILRCRTVPSCNSSRLLSAERMVPSFRQTGDTVGFEASHFRVTVPFSSPITSSNNLRKTAFFSAVQQIKMKRSEFLHCPKSCKSALHNSQFIHPSCFQPWPVSADEKHPKSMILPPPCFILKIFYQNFM